MDTITLSALEIVALDCALIAARQVLATRKAAAEARDDVQDMLTIEMAGHALRAQQQAAKHVRAAVSREELSAPDTEHEYPAAVSTGMLVMAARLGMQAWSEYETPARAAALHQVLDGLETFA